MEQSYLSAGKEVTTVTVPQREESVEEMVSEMQSSTSTELFQA